MNELTANTRTLEIFPWNENFCTGIEEIDVQHKRLVELLNVLVSHLAFNADTPTLNNVFDELKNYTVVHFSTEERIWREHFKQDPWEAWHRDAHGDFIAKVLEIKQQESEMPMDDVIVEIVRFLTHWLALHIIESDKRMAKVVLALPSGISLQRAKDQANEEMTGSTRVLINTVMDMYDKLANRTVELTREISRRIKAEEELRRIQDQLLRLTNAAVHESQAKSTFLASMSHEIRTPMNGVISMVDVLLNTPLSDEQRKMVDVIRDSAHAQLAILNDILDFSKIEADKLDLSLEPFSLAEVIEKTCAPLSGMARKKGVKLSQAMDPAIPPALEGDTLRVRQILSNLVSNAIKFSSGLDRPGQVSVDTRLEGEADGKVRIVLSVRDNGIGMDEATMARVFNPFAQADASTTRKYGGTGLGLVISTRLAEAMGGEIRAESTPDVGSTFSVRLPFPRARAAQLAAAEGAASMQAQVVQVRLPDRDEAIRLGRLILVAEDNEINQSVVRHQLAKLGYQCDIAADGRKAFEKWMSGAYGLLLTDIHMPYMDGYQLAQAIRAEEAKRVTGHLPILALSADVLNGEAERCEAAGMDGYMAKPISLVCLNEELSNRLPALPKAAPPEVPTLSLMLLDDDTFMHDLVNSMLEELGYAEAACYETGESALAAYDAAQLRPDAILLDINMPFMDGIQFVEQLKWRSFSGSLILLSGEDDMTLRATERLAQELNLAVAGSIRKPPSLHRLGQLLRDCGKKSVPDKPKAVSKTYNAVALRAAIANGELVNYYQPKVALPGGEWIGVETLVRWNHPLDGLVLPDQFIPMAEASGMIGDVTRVVLQAAVRQAHLWREAGLDLGVAINVSVDDLSDMAFANFVIDQVAANEIPPHSITLEITEGKLMQNFAMALQVLARLRLKRFRLSIDDFGTGNSSLAQLRDLPFDELKIDRSFTHNACNDERLKAIFSASLEMAKQLRMEVVAEGVEDEHDWNFLLTNDTGVAQGYFVSRPLPAEELEDWHKQWQQAAALRNRS